MSVIINKIELCNWFNYKGDYSENAFNFQNGLNVLVGTNNAGKTKLHNAFRFIIEDKIILNYRTDKGDTYLKISIDESNLIEVYNQSCFRELVSGDTDKIGVKITFTLERRNSDAVKYALTKEIHFRKDINELEIINRASIVEQINIYTNAPRKVSEDFNKLSKSIISASYVNFFLIEGEQMGLMTPLQGAELRRTINTIVNLKKLDELVDKIKFIDKKVDKERRDLEREIDNLTNDEKASLDEINKLEDLIKNNNEIEIPKNEEIIGINKEVEQKWLTSYNRAKENQKLSNELNALRLKENQAEIALDSFRLNITTDYFNPSIFSISKITDDNQEHESLKKLIESIKEFYTERRTELDLSLSEKEQKMMMALEKSQPKPEILKAMVESSDCCYVCSNKLGEAEKEYINKKLIPFFQGDEDEKDPELNKLDSIKGFLSDLIYSTRIYNDKELEYFDDKNELLITLTNNLLEAKQNIDKFIQLNGDVENSEDNQVSIQTYNKAITLIAQAEKTIKDILADNETYDSKIKKLKKTINVDNKKSPKLKEVENLKEFTEVLKKNLFELKGEEYLNFAEKLGEKSTNRFQSLMRYNPTIGDQKIHVETIEKADDRYDFKIDLINKFNEIQDQSGGASSALKQLAVVFGLIDMSEDNVGYPFIADAPLSRLTGDTKEAFFQTLIEDKVFNQCIVITMDLWDNKSNSINKLGEDILNIVEKRADATFSTILPRVNNNGVEINPIKK